MGEKAGKIMRFPNRIPLLNVAALRDYVGKEPEYDYAITLGRLTINDGCGSDYYWDATSTELDDSLNVIKPTAVDGGAAGRWIRVTNTCRVPKTQVIDVISDGTSQQTVTHDMDTTFLDVQVTEIITVYKTDIDVSVGRSAEDVIITFIGGSEPANGEHFEVLLSEIVLVPVAES